MSKRQHKSDPGTETGEVAGNKSVRLLVESVLWVWALAVIGYFYYTRDFHILLQKAWEQVFG
jgi:hypothetical protein